MPTGAEASMELSPRHLLHGGDHLGELTWRSEGDRADQRTEGDRCGFAGDSSQHAPRVSGRLVVRAWERFVVVGTEEAADADRLGSASSGKLLLVRQVHLPLNDHGNLHRRTLALSRHRRRGVR